MWINSALITHQGNVREKNEDNFYYLGSTLADAKSDQYFSSNSFSLSSKLNLFAVFDGMGGMSAGDRASQLSATTAKNEYKKHSNSNATLLMNYICNQSNYIICNEMVNGAKKRMGSTAAMLCLQGTNYYVCNIGDSPVFIHRQNKLFRISAEHSEREMYERLTGTSQAGRKFKLTQHLGIFPEEMAIEPFNASGNIFSGDKFLICSDGLTDMVELTTINQIINNSSNVKIAVKSLMSAALKNGGKDNITIICIEIKKNMLTGMF